MNNKEQRNERLDGAWLKETSILTANERLIVGNTVLLQISVESPAMKYQGQAKQGLPITYI